MPLYHGLKAAAIGRQADLQGKHFKKTRGIKKKDADPGDARTAAYRIRGTACPGKTPGARRASDLKEKPDMDQLPDTVIPSTAIQGKEDVPSDSDSFDTAVTFENTSVRLPLIIVSITAPFTSPFST